MPEQFKNKKFITGFIIVLILIVGAVFVFKKDDIFNISASGEGWLSGWNYRKPVTITSYGGREGTIHGGPTFGVAGKFGSSTKFDGVDDYLTFPDSDDWDFGSDDFTIDFWIYKNSRDGDYNFVVANRVNTGEGWYLSSGIDSGAMSFYGEGASCSFSSDSALPLSQWVHVAVVRNGSVGKIYLNGQTTTSGTCSGTIATSSQALGIGARTPGVNYIDAYIDEVRISKGIARWTANFTPPTSAYTPDGLDVLLLHMDQTSGTSVSSSNYASNINKVGVVNGAIMGATGKFGTSAYFPCSVAEDIFFPDSDDWDHGTADFTYDMWVKLASDAQAQTAIFSHNVSPYSNYEDFLYYPSNGYFYYYYNSGTMNAHYYTYKPLTAGVWQHLALVRSGSQMFLFLNGVKTVMTAGTAFNGSLNGVTGNFRLGREPANPFNWKGGIDEFRLSNGIARWTADFTPPTSPYTTKDSYTKALFHFDEAAGSTKVASYDSMDFTDYQTRIDVPFIPSKMNKDLSDLRFTSSDGSTLLNHWTETASKVGTAYGSTTFGQAGKFGTSVSFSTNADYIKFPASSDYIFPGDYTIDFWINMRTSKTYGSGGHNVWGPDVNDYPCLRVGSDGVQWLMAPGVGLNADSPFSINTWYHVAVVRSGSTVTIYKNGTAIGTMSNSAVHGTAYNMEVGNYIYTVDGYVDEFRVSKGIARWTSNFTSPTTAYTPDVYTKLLLHFDEASGAAIAGSEGFPIDIKKGTISGNPTLGATGKFGTAFNFDGNGDYLSFGPSEDFDFGTGSFTIDFWMNTDAIFREIIQTKNYYSSNGNFTLRVINPTTIDLYTYTGTGSLESKSFTVPAITGGTWNHVALVKNGTSVRLYFNGTESSSGAGTVTKTLNDGGNGLYIGKERSNTYYSGYLDEFRISKGIARWTSNFTPPASPYSPDFNTKLLLHFNEISGTTVTSEASNPVWVKIPSIASTGSTIYIYYDKSSATSTSSGSNTFVFFDDFNSGTSPDTNKWYISGSYSLAAGQLLMTGTGNYTPAMIAKSGGAYLDLETNYSILTRYQHIANTYSVNVPSGFTTESITDLYFWYPFSSSALYFDQVHGSTIYLACGPGEHYYASSEPIFTSGHRNYELKRKTNTSELYLDGNKIIDSGAFAQSGFQRPYIESHRTESRGYLDWYAVRKTSAIEPLYSFGTEESGESASITSVSISTADANICKTEGDNTVCRSGQIITFTSVASGSTIKLYVCKDSTCTNCGLSSTTNCWAYSSSSSASNPTATYDTSSGGNCVYSATPNQYWAKVCATTVCSSVIDSNNTVVP